jgi:hypothetical protein
MSATPHDPPDDEDDLVAYLDGELADGDERTVESQLATDPAARTRAEQYRKTFDLLDYLPRPQPSAEFASRTVTMVHPAAYSGSTQPLAAPPRVRWPEVFGWVVAAVIAGASGFLVHATLRSSVGDPDDRVAEADLPVIQRLPLYLGVDSVEYLRELEKTDLFDTPSSASPPVDGPKLLAEDLPRLIALFRSCSPARQQQLRELHQQLSDPTATDRDALLRTLEGYAVWLDRLPDADRHRVLDSLPRQRLEVVQEVAEVRWREGLSEQKQQAIRRAVGEERAELIAVYREQERARRNEWQLAQRQWKELTGKTQVPWPFNDHGMVRQIDEHIKTAYGIDPARLPSDRDRKGDLPAECRLTRDEVFELRLRREAATQEGYWFDYGALLLRLSEQHPTLPRPKAGDPVVRPAQLPRGYAGFRDVTPRAKWAVGKWPDYALEVVRVARPDPRLEPLGPCKPDDLPDPVRKFVQETLTDVDRRRLDRFAGRWPDYPQELLRVAREKNLSVPDVTLPGEPKKWQEFYQLPSGKK